MTLLVRRIETDDPRHKPYLQLAAQLRLLAEQDTSQSCAYHIFLAAAQILFDMIAADDPDCVRIEETEPS